MCYDIPALTGQIITSPPDTLQPIIGLKLNSIPINSCLHFYSDDYQINRVWNSPEKYIPILRRFSYVLTPDFSLYTDYPKALQIYNHYRKHWLGHYWQENGINVIPTICWSDMRSYEWCFEGEPLNSTVSVSAIGTQHTFVEKKLFEHGYYEMLTRLNPVNIIFYGDVPEECVDCGIEIFAYEPFYKKLRKFDKERDKKYR